jgi:hypothetical protein
MSEELRENAADDMGAAGTPDTAAAAGQGQTQGPGAPAATAGQTQGPAPYALAGEAFTAWFNDRVRVLASPTVMLGTKRAHVVGLLADGRLQVEVETEALEPERQFVAFEAQYLDQLVRKIAAIGL